MNEVNHPFWVIVNKEISDHVKSWRFIILIGIIALTCMGSLYTALTNIGATIKPNDPDGSFLFLKLFTASDGTLPSFTLFINFLGPLLGIALGFDAVNSEQNKGTLSRMLSQPIHPRQTASFYSLPCAAGCPQKHPRKATPPKIRRSNKKMMISEKLSRTSGLPVSTNPQETRTAPEEKQRDTLAARGTPRRCSSARST